MREMNTTKQRLLNKAMDLIWARSYGSVSVDDICKSAKVLKGSFYHFFRSKSGLAAAAFDYNWEKSKADWENIFSPRTPPLERFSRYADYVYAGQEMKSKAAGRVLGCPFTTMGSEMSTHDPLVRKKVQEVGIRTTAYFEKAVRDAQKIGLIPKANAKIQAEELYCFFMGTMVQARIENDLKVLNRLKTGFFRLLNFRLEVKR
jgi:TetR/AcrR family transcriptional repressor of nem operon